MPLYHFYRIVVKAEPNGKCYVGHTQQPLHKRFHDHSRMRERCKSQVLFEEYGKDALEIILIRSIELPDTTHARREERQLFEEYRDMCVNKQRPFVSDDEKSPEVLKEQRRVYYQSNRERLYSLEKQNRQKRNSQKRALYASKKKAEEGLEEGRGWEGR